MICCIRIRTLDLWAFLGDISLVKIGVQAGVCRISHCVVL